jgi:hypothetical protein
MTAHFDYIVVGPGPEPHLDGRRAAARLILLGC